MYEEIQDYLRSRPQTWLVTGVAGFIGSHLAERLLKPGQRVIGLDNFSSGNGDNLTQVKDAVGPGQWRNFAFIEGDIRSLEPRFPLLRDLRPAYREFRAGDVRLSQADIGKAHRLLGYRPVRTLDEIPAAPVNRE